MAPQKNIVGEGLQAPAGPEKDEFSESLCKAIPLNRISNQSARPPSQQEQRQQRPSISILTGWKVKLNYAGARLTTPRRRDELCPELHVHIMVRAGFG